MLSDFSEPGKVSAVATMKNIAPIHIDDKSAKATMQIGQKSRTPMITWRE